MLQAFARIDAKPSDAMPDPLFASAEALGITVAPEWEESVLFHLRLLLQIGAEVADGLPDALDPLPLDRAPEPP